MCLECKPLVKAIDNYIRKADNDLEDQLKAAGFIDPEGTVQEITSLESQVADELKAENDSLATALEGSDDLDQFAKKIWPKFKAADQTDQALREIFTDKLKDLVPALANQYSLQIDPALTVSAITRRTTAWVKSWSKELAGLMKLGNHKEIETILVRGLEEGQGIAEFTQTLMDSGIRDEYYKARRVAVTEVLRAHSYAQNEAMVQSPAVQSKEWVHTGAHANQPRQNHMDMNGQIVLLDQPFVLYGADGGVYYPMFPRDSSLPPGESVNCHCIHRGIVDESVLGLPLEERQRLQAEAIAADDGAWEAELDAQNQAKAGIVTY